MLPGTSLQEVLTTCVMLSCFTFVFAATWKKLKVPGLTNRLPFDFVNNYELIFNTTLEGTWVEQFWQKAQQFNIDDFSYI